MLEIEVLETEILEEEVLETEVSETEILETEVIETKLLETAQSMIAIIAQYLCHLCFLNSTKIMAISTPGVDIGFDWWQFIDILLLSSQIC